MRKLFKERKLFMGGNYMRKYGTFNVDKMNANWVWSLMIYSEKQFFANDTQTFRNRK